MLHPLEQKLVALRRHARPMAVLHGLCIMATALLAALVAMGLLDYLIRFQDRGLRVIASLVVFGVYGWTLYRYVLLAFWMRLGTIDLAKRVQRQFPRLGDQLVTAVDFLHTPDDDPAAGSVALRRTVVARATAEAESLDFSRILDLRPVLRAGIITTLAYTAAVALCLLPNSPAGIAVNRLLNPFGNTAWPRTTNLAVRKPLERIARGQTFQIEVIDTRGVRLPPDVRIHYRLPTSDGNVVEETERMRPADGAMLAQRENVTRPFSYRVEGGDDQSMPWANVNVVDPPAVESVSIHLTAPSYTGRPPIASDRNIRALVGTRVEITAKAAKPLASAILCLENGRKIPATVADDDAFSVAFVVDKSGPYWFDLTDREDLHGGADDRWEILALPDAPPAVNIEKPNANLFVTPAAVVPLRISAKDDLALHDIALVFRLAKSSPERSLPLFSGPAQPPSQSEPAAGDNRIIDYRWDLASLNLQPGAQITFHATADDYLPQTAKSNPRQLTVVSFDDMQDRIAEREKLVAAELDRALKMQRDCRNQIVTLRTRLSELHRLEQTDVDGLQAAEHSQRDVDRVLTGRGEGVPMHALSLLADLDNNGIDNADIRQRIASLLAELDRLDRDLLPPIGRELTAAVKTAQVDRERQKADAQAIRIVDKSLAAVAERQDSIIASIQQQIAQLVRWDGYRRLHREIGQLIRDQEDAARRTSEVGRRTLTHDLRDLSPQDAADLKIAAARQLEIARQLDRLLQEADQSTVDLRKTDPLAAETVADALAEARRLAISGQMRTAAGHIQENQIGQAAAAQKHILQDLREVLDILAHQRQNETTRLLKKLREAQADLATLEQRQDELRIQTNAAAKNRDAGTRNRDLQRLARAQQQLRDEAERLARQLARLQAEKPAEAVDLAARQMADAQQRAAQGDAAEAARQAANAQRSLADARRRLDDHLNQADARLTAEQVARLDDEVKHLRRQQENALDEARRLYGLEQSQGQLTRSQAISLRDLAKLQRSLQTDTAQLAERLRGAAAFELALVAAATEMNQAADSLDRRQIGPPTQDAQRRATNQLNLLVEALKPEQPVAQDQGSNAGNNTTKRNPPGAGLPPLAELKFLKLMQQDINARLDRLQQAVAPGKPTPEQSRQYTGLSEQQGRLADILSQSVEQTNPNTEPPEKPSPQIKPTYLTLVDERQLKRELGAAAEKEDDNPLAEIARQMRDAQRRIARLDSGPATQQLQRQIVDDLDRLIEQARKSSGQCQSQSQSTSPKSPTGSPRPQPNARTTQHPNKNPPTNTSTHTDKPARRKPDAAATQAIMKRLWGTLPERQREQMLQSPVEEFPPKYELEIEDYFRRLSEEKRGE
jgi:hypothetical protein